MVSMSMSIASSVLGPCCCQCLQHRVLCRWGSRSGWPSLFPAGHALQCLGPLLQQASLSLGLQWPGGEAPAGRACDHHAWAAEAAAKARPEEFAVWREKPGDFEFEDGRKPLDEAYERARDAWRGKPAVCMSLQHHLASWCPAVGCVALSGCAADGSAAIAEILRKPGASHLVVTHKSMTRALMGVALGLPPTGFRFLQIGNGSVSVWRINKQAKPILVTLNLTAHISSDGVFY